MENNLSEEEITEKQLKFIKDIETYTGIKFTGRRKNEAIEYIKENKDKFYKEKSKEYTAKIHNLLKKGL